jgi:hypothetical protein
LKNLNHWPVLAKCLFCESACVNGTGTRRNDPSKSITFERHPDSVKQKPSLSDRDKPDPAIVGPDSAIKFYTIGKDNHVQIGMIKFNIPDTVNFTSANLYAGIYELKSDSLIRRKYLVIKNLVFITTFDDVGMGYQPHYMKLMDPTFDLLRTFTR